MEKNIPSLHHLKSLRKPVRNISLEHRKKLNGLEKLALAVTRKIGSMGFFFLILCWTALWLSWNTLGPQELRFDPFPAFVLWIFISNAIQIMLLPLIMVGQNLQSRHAEIRAENDFEINLKVEREIETVLLHLEQHEEVMTEILKRLEEKKDSFSPENKS